MSSPGVIHSFCGKVVEIPGLPKPINRKFMKIRRFAQEFVMRAQCIYFQ